MLWSAILSRNTTESKSDVRQGSAAVDAFLRDAGRVSSTSFSRLSAQLSVSAREVCSTVE